MLCAKPVKNAEIQIFEIHIDAFAISYIFGLFQIFEFSRQKWFALGCHKVRKIQIFCKFWLFQKLFANGNFKENLK